MFAAFGIDGFDARPPIIDDVLYELGLETVDVITQRQAMAFLARLQRELPETLNRQAIIRDLGNEILPSAIS